MAGTISLRSSSPNSLTEESGSRLYRIKKRFFWPAEHGTECCHVSWRFMPNGIPEEVKLGVCASNISATRRK